MCRWVVFPSIFLAEVYAICLFAEANLERNLRSEDIAIPSDSLAALKRLSSFEIESSLVLEAIEKFNLLEIQNRIAMVADTLAEKAAASLLIGYELFHELFLHME